MNKDIEIADFESSGLGLKYCKVLCDDVFYIREKCNCGVWLQDLNDFLKEIEDEDEEFSWDWIVDWLVDRYCYSCDSKIGCSLSVVTCNKVKKDYENITKV